MIVDVVVVNLYLNVNVNANLNGYGSNEGGKVVWEVGF